MQKVIMGVFNQDRQGYIKSPFEPIVNHYFWKVDEPVEIGDYAIVENRSGFDLVRVIGTAEIDDSKISAHKRVIAIIRKNVLEKPSADVPF